MLSAEEIIELLNLKPLQHEGGYYRETYRSEDTIPSEFLPARYPNPKSICTAIYYLLTPDTFSSIHRLPTDEIFHFYLGDPVVMLLLYPDRKSEEIILGSEIDNQHQVQVVVPSGTWQGSFLKEGGKLALMGTTMAPGFDFNDYEAGDRYLLEKKYPDRKDLIIKLTR